MKRRMGENDLVYALAALPFVPFFIFLFARFLLSSLGSWLRSRNKHRRDAIFLQYRRDVGSQGNKPDVEDDWEQVENSATKDAAPSKDWAGLIGFFHPFCNAGGGGERLLWAAVAETQRRLPKAICVVYTGDHDMNLTQCIEKVKERFDITLQEHTLHLIYLSRRHWVLATTWPHFTLLGQSLGSLILAFEALSALTPDIFIDTMGYAFAIALCKYLVPSVPTAAYVHYPTISTDMLDSLDDTTGVKGVNAGRGRGIKGLAKKIYWHIFAWLYGWVGDQVDVVMCNSTWTSNHITKLWEHKFEDSDTTAPIVYPPCPVEELKSKIEVSEASESKRENIVLYIAQFRPEKNHGLVLRAFSKHYHSKPASDAKLVLIGSVRSNAPDERHVYSLRLLARELKIQDATTFLTDAPFSTILEYLQKSNISVNGMYNEHFGIGNVEGIAAGLIPVVHNSGGPKLDIVVPFEGLPIGYHAETEDEYAEAFANVDRLTKKERIAMRLRGRESAARFSEEVFAQKWGEQIDTLVKMFQTQDFLVVDPDFVYQLEHGGHANKQ